MNEKPKGQLFLGQDFRLGQGPLGPYYSSASGFNFDHSSKNKGLVQGIFAKIIKGSVHDRLSSSPNSKENIKKWIGMMQTRRITIYLMNFVVKCDLWSTLELRQ
jgi:hypothetical protein